MLRSLIWALFSLAIYVATACSEDSMEWSQFRGPRGAGVSPLQVALPDKLEGAQQKWRVEIPPGHSSPIVVEGRIFLTGYANGKLLTLCYLLADGSEVWRHEQSIEQFERTHPQHGPASCTPASDGQRLFAVFGSYGVLAFDLDGRLLWDRKVEQHPNLFGTAASPICHDQRLILLWGNEDESILQSVNPSDGQVVWERKRPGPASTWSTPTILESSIGAQILIYEPYHLRACSWEGVDLWSVPGLADEPITVPQIGGDLVFATSYNLRTNTEATSLPTFAELLVECDKNGDQLIDAEEARNNQSILSRPDADGEGDHPLRMFFRMLDEDKSGAVSESEWPRIHSWMDPWKHANGLIAIKPGTETEPATLAWEQASGVPECPTPIIVGDAIYLVRNGGVVTAIGLRDGVQRFQERLAGGGPYYASPIFGDSKLFLASARGQVTILDVSSNPPQVLSSNLLDEKIYATPAICHGGVIIRTEQGLLRFANP